MNHDTILIITENWNLINEIVTGKSLKFKYSSHYVKTIQIRIFSWSVFCCIQSEYRKIQTRKNSAFGHFSLTAFPNIHLNFGVKNLLRDRIMKKPKKKHA